MEPPKSPLQSHRKLSNGSGCGEKERERWPISNVVG